MDKFKVLARDEFGNQGQCLAALLNLYEIEQSKHILVERKLDVESFQAYQNKINELFLMSLQLNSDAEIRIRGEFDRLLDSNSRTIIDLQTKVTELTNANKEHEESVNQTKTENREHRVKIFDLEKVIEKQNKDYFSTLEDKDNLNKLLTDNCNQMKTEIEVLKSSAEATIEQLKKLNEMEVQNTSLTSENTQLKSEIERQKELSEFQKDKAVLEIQKVNQEKLSDLNSKHNEEIKNYITHIDTLQKQHELFQKQINELVSSRTKEKPKEIKKIKGL
jgi:chromosome segregation ATPase